MALKELFFDIRGNNLPLRRRGSA